MLVEMIRCVRKVGCDEDSHAQSRIKGLESG